VRHVDHCGWMGARIAPFFVIKQCFFDLYTCMVVAQLSKFPASQEQM